MAATTPSTDPTMGAVGAPGPAATAVSTPVRGGTRPAAVLLVALLALWLYAAFAHGATDLPAETRLQIPLALVAVITAVAWLSAWRIRVNASRAAWWGAALLAIFAGWCGLSVLWSIAPDRSWLEFNRAISYALVVVLGFAVGASLERAVEKAAIGALLVSCAVALYALAGKVAPGLHWHPFFDLNDAGAVSRLREPLQYWNALALVCVLGIPIALRLAVDPTRRTAGRLAAAAAALLLVVDLGLTYSRGGVLAAVTVAVVLTVMGGARLRGLAAIALTAAAAAPALAVGFSKDGLSKTGAPLADRIHDGRILLLVMAGALAALLVVAFVLITRVEPRVRWTDARSRRIWRALAALAAFGALVGFVGLVASQRGLSGTISHSWHSFTSGKADNELDPQRLVSTNSGVRWVLWEEAVGAFSDKPFGGYGAGSFELAHKLYRKDPIPVTQPHSVPLQFLAENGLIGALLVLGGLALLFRAGRRRLNGLPQGRERDLGVALLAGAVGWFAHGLYDWDWDIPGVTFPAMLFLGVVCATPIARGHRFGEPTREGVGLRTTVLAVSVLALSLYVISSLLPAWSDGKTTAAQEGASTTNQARLADAAAEADLAAKLNPFAVRPLFVAAAIAQGRGRPLDGRQFLLDAADRQPQNPDVWFRLANIALQFGDLPGYERAARRLYELDPANDATRSAAARAQGLLAPPESSATATGTPLSPGFGPAPVTPAPVAPVAPVAPTVPLPPASP